MLILLLVLTLLKDEGNFFFLCLSLCVIKTESVYVNSLIVLEGRTGRSRSHDSNYMAEGRESFVQLRKGEMSLWTVDQSTTGLQFPILQWQMWAVYH